MEGGTMEKILYGGSEGTENDICRNCDSLGELLFQKLQTSGTNIVLIDAISGIELSGLDLLSKSVHLSNYLQQSFNIRSGDVISICSENRIEFAITNLAILFIGATIAPINHSYTENEINHAINLSKPKIVFVSPPIYNKVETVAQKNNFIECLILYDTPSTMIYTKNAILFTTIMETECTSNLNKFRCEPQNIKENIAVILCSSGTTGLPKGVQVTQFNIFVANMQCILRRQESEMPKSGANIILGQLPMYHTFGLCVFLDSTLTINSKYVLLPRFTEESFLRTIERYKVTIVFVVPPIMIFLAKSPIVSKYDLSSINAIRCGAAPLSKDIENMVKKRIGVKNIFQGYGMTEGTYSFCSQTERYNTNGSVGVLVRGVYGRVVDIESGELLGANQIGELQFKSKSIMKGYIGNAQATSDTIDADGWLHTGDVGYYDTNGELYIVDRIKELIKFKGFQVPPAEIEAVLLSHPQIKDTGVVGVPHEKNGEAAFAFVVKQPNAMINEPIVFQYVAERLSYPKQLHGGIKFIDAIPKSLTGKILRRILRDMAKDRKSKL